ncbi:MAG: glutamate-5-semialdehyde dehydrogenase [Oscillospiraceae bacterium]|jgi:glutamate-5-semialdehyde dehydrogenase|nr:glutamate-5-semialdehyde dehydrogenase [Oscillospiraceae bacterium]
MEKQLELREIGRRAADAERVLAGLPSMKKDNALMAVADAIAADRELILYRNKLDVDAGREAGLSAALLDRLLLNPQRFDALVAMFHKLAAMPDPVGRILSGTVRPNGLKISKITVPLGVIAMIYEARPNVTADSAALCLKSGNAVILKGGKEAINSNVALVNAMRKGLQNAGLPQDCVQLVIDDADHTRSNELMRLNEFVDVIIPRGGAALIRAVVENSTVPVIETGVGNCHIYVDKNAQIDMAARIVFNAKTSRPSVCNACETLLLHKDIAGFALLRIKERLDTMNVEMVGDEAVCGILPGVAPATEEDWATEYGDYKISVKIVKTLDEAIAHINKYGTRHSEAIITENYASAEKFIGEVDAAAVYVNASTRFTDGEEFGFGAEIGISTQKLHARGPVGLEELTSVKYVIRGSGQIRE